jgi:hypothetical protein
MNTASGCRLQTHLRLRVYPEIPGHRKLFFFEIRSVQAPLYRFDRHRLAQKNLEHIEATRLQNLVGCRIYLGYTRIFLK